MTKSMNSNTLSSSVAALSHDIVAPVPRKPCSISADNYRRSWPELTLSSSPERRAGQEILNILFSRAAVTSPTGNSIPSCASSRASISPSSATLVNHPHHSHPNHPHHRHRYSYDARMVSSSGRMVGAVILHDDDDDDEDASDNKNHNNNNSNYNTTSTPLADATATSADETTSLHPLHKQQQHHHHHQQLSSSSSLSDESTDSQNWWESSSGNRLESMSPALSNESPSPALLLGVTPPTRADNPLALNRSFFSLAIGAELGLLNFSPPLRDAH